MKQFLKSLLLFFSFITFINNTANAEGSGASENSFGWNSSSTYLSSNVKICATSDFMNLYMDISDCNLELKYSDLARKKIPLIKINAEMYNEMKNVDRKIGRKIAATKEVYGIDNSDKFYEMVVEERRKIYEKLKAELEKELNLSKNTTTSLPKNSYKGIICFRTNKNSWTPNAPLEYENMYIFNELSSCKSITYSAERTTYEEFIKIKENPHLYVKNFYNLKELRKKFKNKICLNKTTGKISNITKLCDKNEKELVISNESSKYNIILVSKNSKEKTQIAKVEETTKKDLQQINLSNCRETDLVSNKLINNDPVIFDKININLLTGETIAKSKNKIYQTKTKIDDNYDPKFNETLKVMFPSGYRLVILKINHKLGLIEHGQYGNVKLVCEKINGTNTKYANLFKNNDTKLAKKEITKDKISINDWFKWVEIYPSALKDGTYLSKSKKKGFEIIDKIKLGKTVYVPNTKKTHYKYKKAIQEQEDFNNYEGNKNKVLAVGQNYYIFSLAAGYHKNLKQAVRLALKNCKDQSGSSYENADCVVVMINDKKITYKEQGYWSELILNRPTLIKKYYETFYPKSFDKNYLAKSFYKDQLSKFNKDTLVAEVEEPKQKEFIPKKTSQDKNPPVIKIAESITVNDSSYEISGTLEDKSKKLFIEVDGQTIPVKKGKFKLKRYSPVDEKVKLVAIDQWGNKSKPKIVNIIVDIKNVEVAEKVEPLNPTKMRSKRNSNRVALIIGIEKYIRTPAANFANLDAKFFYEYSRKGFGIPKSNIKLLVDEEANLVKSLSTLSKWLPSKVKAGETELIIFFAGHGLASSDGKELYILPYDSDPDLLNRTALSRSELFKQIIDLNPKSVTMFMDTCYSGISRDEKMLLASARPIRIIADEENDIPSNFTIFTASQLNQISSGMNEAKHGIFSYYLMKGLEGNADNNKDRVLTNGELLSYMDKNVSEKASLLGRNQNPSLAGDPNKILMSYR